MYSDSTGTGPGIFLLVLGFVFAVLYVWAMIVVIVAGHRYLYRTSPRLNRGRRSDGPDQG